MNIYIALTLTFCLTSCSTSPNTKITDSSLNSDNNEMRRLLLKGMKELGPNPFPKSKHYHAKLDIEHSHANPGYIHNPMDISASTYNLFYFKHSHGQKTHIHFAPLAGNATSIRAAHKHEHRRK